MAYNLIKSHLYVCSLNITRSSSFMIVSRSNTYKTMCFSGQHCSLITLFPPRLLKFIGRVKSVRFHSKVTSVPQDSVHSECTPKTFHALISFLRNQAQRSLLVEIQERSSYPNLCKHCEKFGKVLNSYYYELKNKEFLLMEFESCSAVKAILQECNYPNDDDVIPVQSRLLQYFNSDHNFKGTCITPLKSFNVPSESDTYENLQKSSNTSTQMEELFKLERLSDLGTRLRFFICSQVEESISSIFPSCYIFPFGSSINGFGRHNCDLDMYLELIKTRENTAFPVYFHVKHSGTNQRGRIQRTLETLGDFFQHFVPGMTQIQRILRATVPILKFRHEMIGVDCDLSLSNRSGIYMSELLYLYGELDYRIRPLVFTIRKWAKENLITSSVPGRGISNFSLILMVVFFLQNRPVPVIPTLSQLANIAGMSDIREAEGITLHFLKNNEKLKQCANKEDLGSLLHEFFAFYEMFDFKEKGLSIVTGQSFTKHVRNSLLIQNPIEQELNVSKNVNHDEVNRFSAAARTALWQLEANSLHDDNEHWGILKLFESPYQSALNKEANSKQFQVKDLFDRSLFDASEQAIASMNRKNFKKLLANVTMSQSSGTLNSQKQSTKVYDVQQFNKLLNNFKRKQKVKVKKKRS